MRCEVCGASPVAVVVHGGAGEAALARGFCEEHAPLRLALGDSPARAAVVEGFLHANPHSPASLYDAAAVRLRAGRFLEAEALAGEAILLDPARVLPRELLSEALERAGKAREALSAAFDACALEAADGESFALLGRLRACAGDRAGALASFEEGAARDPWSFECARRAAVLRLSAGALIEARALLERFLEGTAARAAEVIPVAVGIGPEATPGAPPPATVESFSSELRYREALRREGRRRSHVVAAARYQARILLARALAQGGLEAEAVGSVERALAEIESVPRILLMEAGLDLGE